MKPTYLLRLFILSICLKTYAQRGNYHGTNIVICITESTLDSQNDEIIELQYRKEQVFYKDDKIFPKIDVRSQSKLRKVRYYRFGFLTKAGSEFFPVECPDEFDKLGATAPVIIPPIGGDDDDDDDERDVTKIKVNDLYPFSYPYFIKKELWLPSNLIEYQFYLRAYEDKQTYLDDDEGRLGEVIVCGTMMLRILDMDRPQSSLQTVNVYPNPFTNQIFIKLDEALNDTPIVKVFGANGREIILDLPLIPNNRNKNIYRMNTAALAKGLYYYHIILEDKLIIRKLIKE